MKHFIIVIVTILLFASWSKDQSHAAGSAEKQRTPHAGETSAPAVQAVTIAQLLRAPKTYEGQEVVVSGVFVEFCADGDFVMKDGLDALEFYVSDQVPVPPKTRLGSKIQIRGTVKVRRNEVSIVAKEVKFQ